MKEIPVDKSEYNLLNPVPREFMRELSADRPDKTDSPFTVDAGHFQVEMDFANYTHDREETRNGKIRVDGFQIAPVNVKAGVLNNTDVQLVLNPYQWERTKNEKNGSVERNAGFGDIVPRAKINLMGNDGGFFALGLIPFIKLPTNQDHLGNNSVEGGLGIPYAVDIPNWDIGFQTTFSANRDEAGQGHHAEFANSVSIGHKLIGNLSLSGEFFSNVSTERGSDWVGTVDTWLTYQINENMRFDGGVYIGVTRAADDLHSWIGMTWRY